MTPNQRDRLRALVREVPDFPRPGVGFKDLSPLWADPAAFATVVEQLAEVSGAGRVDAVAGIEARGFVLAAALALHMGTPLVLVRKAGKLPGPVHERAYDLEYGRATLAVRHDAVEPGQRVLLVDDVLATGGTAAAAAALLGEAGADVVALAVLAELSFLPGRAALGGLPVTAVLDYAS